MADVYCYPHLNSDNKMDIVDICCCCFFFSARELLFYTLHSNTHNVTFVTTGRSLNLWVVGHLKDNNKKTNKFTYYLGKKGITFKSNKQRPLFFVPRDSGDEGLRVNASHLIN